MSFTNGTDAPAAKPWYNKPMVWVGAAVALVVLLVTVLLAFKAITPQSTTADSETLVSAGERQPTTASPSVAATPSKFTPAAVPNKPSDLLDLSNWYLGIPVDTDHVGNPDIIY